MPSAIISRTFSLIQDNRAVIDNSNFARRFHAGNWKSIRVAVRMSVRDSGTDITSIPTTPRFAIGLCSGNSNLFLQNTCQHFIGFITSPNWFTLEMARNVIGNTNYEFFGKPGKKVGAVISEADGNAGQKAINYVYDSTVANRSMVFIDITRPQYGPGGSGTFSFNTFARQIRGAEDASLSNFTTQAVTVPPVFTDHKNITGWTLDNVDENTDGILDHVSVAWNKTTNPVEISDVGFVRLL
jgi:hypothetical protein